MIVALQVTLLALVLAAVVAIGVGTWSWFLLSMWNLIDDLKRACAESERMREELQDRYDSLLAEVSESDECCGHRPKEVEDEEEDDGEGWKKAGAED